MRIEIQRQACCSADDQIGPLEMIVDAAPDETLENLVSRIKDARFLQFSSSHSSIMGRTGNSEVVRIYSNKDPEYFVDQQSVLSKLVKDGKIIFRF